MTENQKLDLILSEITGMKTDMQGMKADMHDMGTDIKDLRQRISNIEVHLENVTDKNIILLAENFVELTNKLSQAIPYADKNRAYEVKVNYVLEEVDKLKKEVSKLIDKPA